MIDDVVHDHRGGDIDGAAFRRNMDLAVSECEFLAADQFAPAHHPSLDPVPVSEAHVHFSCRSWRRRQFICRGTDVAFV